MYPESYSNLLGPTLSPHYPRKTKGSVCSVPTTPPFGLVIAVQGETLMNLSSVLPKYKEPYTPKSKKKKKKIPKPYISL